MARRFQVKDFQSLTASTVNYVRATNRRLTDFNVGSKIRTLLEAVNQEIDELYQQMLAGLREGIPTAIYRAFRFPAEAAQPASGLIRVTVAAAAEERVIGAGARLTREDASRTYRSTNDARIPAGATLVDVPCAAEVAGTAGNMPAGLQFSLVPSPAGFVSASNLAPFVNGTDVESEDDRGLRFVAYVATISRATGAALEYGAKTTTILDEAGNVVERVRSARVIEPDLTDVLAPDRIVRVATAAANVVTAVPAGKSVSVWSNGTDVIVAGSSIPDAALTGFSTTTTPPVDDSSTRIANTAWVQAEMLALAGFIGSGWSSTGATTDITAPSWARFIEAMVVGAGGGGGGTGTTNTGGGGGGSGGHAWGNFAVTPGQVLRATIGGGGAGSTGKGVTGGTTSLGSLMSASGGEGGNSFAQAPGGGAGGFAFGGTILNLIGNCGGDGCHAAPMAGNGGPGLFGMGAGRGGQLIGVNASAPGAGGGGGYLFNNSGPAMGNYGGGGAVLWRFLP